jgi:TRAP-type C4-dicarboxylate transport system permease small subunit
MTGEGTARFVRAVDRLSIALARVASVFMAAATLIVCWMVLWRITGHSTYWEIEMAVYLIVAAVLVGSPYCLMTGGHIGVDLVSHLLSPVHRRRLERVLAVLGIVVCLYLAWKGLELTIDAFEKNERSGSSWNPPRWPFFAMMPLGLGLTALQYVAEMLRPQGVDTSGQAISGQGA